MSRTATPEWTAPKVERPGGFLLVPEAQMLPEMLAWHRSTLLAKCSGLTGAQLAACSVPPSGLGLLGLIRHLRKVERIWLRQRMAGQDVEPLHGSGTGRDLDFDETDAAVAEQDYAALVARHNGHADLVRECVDGVTGA